MEPGGLLSCLQTLYISSYPEPVQSIQKPRTNSLRHALILSSYQCFVSLQFSNKIVCEFYILALPSHFPHVHQARFNHKHGESTNFEPLHCIFFLQPCFEFLLSPGILILLSNVLILCVKMATALYADVGTASRYYVWLSPEC
jgi:hypothetical protein